MTNLTDEFKKLKEAKHGDFVELKAISLKKLINQYRKNNLKNFLRLKCLLYYYPNVFDESTIEDIEITISHPDMVHMTLNKDDYRYKALDDIFKTKYNGDLEHFQFGRYIKVVDLFEYFHL